VLEKPRLHVGHCRWGHSGTTAAIELGARPALVGVAMTVLASDCLVGPLANWNVISLRLPAVPARIFDRICVVARGANNDVFDQRIHSTSS